MTVFILFCTIVAIMAAIGFDFLKRKGDAYFEEPSDELHGSKISDKEYSLKGRIIMRGYSNHVLTVFRK